MYSGVRDLLPPEAELCDSSTGMQSELFARRRSSACGGKTD
eukprot:CAMPEP_0179280972 /NCGR_PEP_ID=MMETSP0797-20121207/36904_1 /TAXON_ID=47934 /ORGANISM="Dinophysis acuminata, Strain DAEP01" /LENGTH=40 /DNA_ID= /DNA_START= /DNA_END= /DNA_ORIENTATION=